jgi:hypothetical protein
MRSLSRLIAVDEGLDAVVDPRPVRDLGPRDDHVVPDAEGQEQA